MTGMSYEIEDDSSYLFACAELKTREVEFVNDSKLERMLSATDMEEFLKVLGETVYASDISGIEAKGSFEEVIVSSYQEINGYLESRLKPEHRKLIHILFFEEFLHNLKLILKSSILKKDFKHFYIPIKYEYSLLMEAYNTGKYEDSADPIQELIQHLRELAGLSGGKDIRKLELDFEAFYIKKLLDTARSLKRKMIEDYMRHKIDLTNIETIYRNSQLKDKSGFTDLLYDGGSLGLKMLAGLENESMDYIVKKLEHTYYGDAIMKGAQKLFSDCSFSSYERNRDLYFMEYFDRIKYSVSNLEKIFQFFLKKKIELININILYTGIRYNADKSNLRCRVE
jgi:vacuolar-type H+-ATPase subunit C/Vma6